MEQQQPKIISLLKGASGIFTDGYVYEEDGAYSARITPRLNDEPQRKILGMPVLMFGTLFVFAIITSLYLYVRFKK